MFLESAVETLETWTSDRNPIMMTVLEKGRGLRYNRRTFPQPHYEDSQSLYGKYKEIVKQELLEQRSWSNKDVVECLKKQQKNSMAQLQSWSKEELGDRSQKLEKPINELKEVKQQNQHYVDSNILEAWRRKLIHSS